MSTLLLTVGAPASGKSTWAKAWVAEDPGNRLRVNRDDTRTFLGVKHGENEPLVSSTQQMLVRSYLNRGHDVVVDDTNLVAKFAKEWLKVAAEVGAEVEWHEEFLKVDVRTCIDRDRDREAKVGQDVIMKMAQRAKSWKRPTLSEGPDLSGFKPYTGTPGKPKVFLVDIDGTIAHNGGHRGFFDWAKVGADTPIEAIIRIVRAVEASGVRPLYVSGRDEVCFSETLNWILDEVYHSLLPTWPIILHMRPQGDQRKDSIVKLEIFDKHIRDNYDVQFALDDRDQVIRAYRDVLGLTVLQCRDGAF